MKLSIVTTLYQSAPHIEEFHRRATEAARNFAGDDYEIVMVNDGSPDNSLELALALADNDPRLVLVDLSRNFGHHKALMTGMAHAEGEYVYLIDSDLEEEPEWLALFAREMEQNPADVVFGVQQSRKGKWFERVSGKLYYAAFNALSQAEIPPNSVVARLMSRRYVNALVAHTEREIFIDGLFTLTGFRQTPYPIKKHASSESTYTFKKKVALAVNSITSFTSAPLVGIFYLGMIISFFSSCYIAYLVFKKLFSDVSIAGWTSTIASIWFIGGLIILFIGIVGIYIAKLFSEVKSRPYVIIRDVYGKKH